VARPFGDKTSLKRRAVTVTTPNPPRAIGIDIGGTKIAVAAVDRSGRIAARTQFTTQAELGFDRALAHMVEAVDRVLAQAGWSRGDLCGLGVGCTGPVSAELGIINNPYTLPTWIDCDIVGRLRAVFDRDVYLENDADAAALGECFAGGARNCRRVVMLTVGTGVGGGVVIDGRVYRGTRGEHPELGHIPIDASGLACYCGTKGCLESIASGTAIAAAGQAAGFGDSREVFAKAALGEQAALAIVARVQSALATAAWTILHTFMPELIVLGGGVMDEHYELLAPAVADTIGRATMVPPNAARVVRAQLGNDAGLIGAASLTLAKSGA
jgi:glucokinase